ncbi:uncharacterized protein [Engystomops pustulosus]|uniref:uncharacterized protein n=1 Tax=Engystomops pustulosus TaxID=76066 RepID=UPI003AFB1995
MKCPQADGILTLSKECEHQEVDLISLWCHRLHIQNKYEPRLHLDTSSGCWTLTDARKDDSCVYNVTFHRKQETSLHSIDIIVLDPILFYNITRTSILLGQDIAVSVQFSGEEAAVTWDVVGGRLPDRYRLINDNRTMIIPSAQREDAGRRLRVRITNPISEETREYRLEITASGSSLQFLVYVALPVLAVKVIFLLFLITRGKTQLIHRKQSEASQQVHL